MVTITDKNKNGDLWADLVIKLLGTVPERRVQGHDAERRNLVPNNESRWPPSRWQSSTRRNYSVIQDPIFLPGSFALNFATQEMSPDSNDFIFQTDLGVPQLIAVSWPKALDPKVTKKVPYLIYFRPKPNTNGDRWGPSYVGAGNLGSYPLGWDFLYYEFWAYLNYRCDPLTYWEERWHPSRDFIRDAGSPGLRETNEKFSFGLPLQIAASGKPVVLIFPLLHQDQTLGRFFEADIAQQTLEAIQAFVFAKAGVISPPLGSIALAGYSFSVDFVTQFLKSGARHPFVTTLLKEIYLFDPSQYKDAGNRAIKAALDWTGSNATKAIRIYSQTWFDRFSDLLGGRVANSPSYRESMKSRKRSVAFFPIQVWQDAQAKTRREFVVNSLRKIREDAREDPSGAFADFRRFTAAERDQSEYDRFNKIENYFDVHFTIPATMLTDALRRSELM